MDDPQGDPLMALTAWPAEADSWLQKWVVWRMTGKGDRPPEAPDEIPDYAWEFILWVQWRRWGRPDPRPDIAKSVPQWAYPIYEALNKLVPVSLPPSPHGYVLPWAIWRFQGEPADLKPAGLPPEIAAYAWTFLNFAAWRRKSPLPPRPALLPPVIPNWAWGYLKQINQAVPTTPLPPPPPPPAPIPSSSWKLPLPLVFTTWGPVSNSDYRDTNAALERMRTAGVKTVAIQAKQFLPDFPDRVRAFGMKVALWGRPDSDDAEQLALARAEGYIPQIEGEGEYTDAIRNLEAGVGRGLSIAIVTTLAGLDEFFERDDKRISTREVERLKAAGCTMAFPEVYLQALPHSIIVMEAECRQRGFDHVVPIIGLYWNWDMGAYQPSLAQYGRQIGIYMSEGMTDANWADLRDLGT